MTQRWESTEMSWTLCKPNLWACVEDLRAMLGGMMESSKCWRTMGTYGESIRFGLVEIGGFVRHQKASTEQRQSLQVLEKTNKAVFDQNKKEPENTDPRNSYALFWFRKIEISLVHAMRLNSLVQAMHTELMENTLWFGVPAALDLAITAPQRQDIVALAGATSLATATSYAATKASHLNTAALGTKQGVHFMPIVAEPTGAWEPEASKLLLQLSRCTAIRKGDDAATLHSGLLRELSVIIRSHRALAVLCRRAELGDSSSWAGSSSRR